MSFLGLEGRTFLIFGVANRKSIAWLVGRTLESEGAKVCLLYTSPSPRDQVVSRMPSSA